MSAYIGTDHISFTVADIERSLVFYRDTLGLPVIADQKPGHAHHTRLTGFAGAQLRTVFLALPGVSTKLGLVQYIHPPGEPQNLATNKIGDAHICLEVADIHRVYEEWQTRGAHFKSEPISRGPEWLHRVPDRPRWHRHTRVACDRFRIRNLGRPTARL